MGIDPGNLTGRKRTLAVTLDPPNPHTQDRARRTVLRHALDNADYVELVGMLGLDEDSPAVGDLVTQTAWTKR